MQLSNTARAALPALAENAVIALTFRGKTEQWRIFDVLECSPALAADMQARGWEGKQYSAQRILTGAKRRANVAIVYRNARTGVCAIAVV